MPQINIGSAGITTFGYSVTFDILNRTITFNLLPFTTGPGLANTKVAFSVQDSAGVVLASIDFNNPQIPNPAVNPVYVLDLSDSPYAFLFSSFSIVGAIQDQGGQVYTIQPLIKTLCMPNDFQETGSVPGMFQIISDCSSNSITVKELTLQVYNSLKPITVTKSGTLYYPTGTISPINFTNTPWTNNVVYTGQYRIKDTTYATYDLGNDFYVVVGYVTDQVFDITCTSKMSNLLCCLREVQQTALKNCDNAVGDRANQLIQEVTVPFVAGMLAEMRGMDASAEYALVKRTLNCSCGNSSIGQNEVDPVNPAVNTIVISGVGGTNVSSSVTGSTKNFVIKSNAYQVVKGAPADPGLTIGLDNSVPNITKYPITLNYLAIAQEVYTATENDPATLAQLNNLVNALGIDLTGLDGQCIIDLTKVTYTAALAVTGSTGVVNVVINGNIFVAPGGLLANNVSAFQNWLNSLALGSWTVTLNSGTVTILSIDNTNSVSTITFSNPNVTLQFGRTTKTLVQILQAVISYLCGLTALQMTVGASLSVCTIDYNGNVITTPFAANSRQSDFNTGVSNALCNIASRITSLTAVTCDRIKTIFQDNPNAVFNYATDRFLSYIGGACNAITGKQAAMAIISAIQSDPQTLAAFCAIDCAVPASCPDISAINMSIVSGNIAIYGASFNGPTTSGQTVTVRYRLTGSSSWTVSTNNLLLFPNGNINGTSPYLITGVTPGQSYDVQILNNCGGVGFISSITVPASAVFSTNVILGNLSYLVCSGSPITVYSSSSFGPGAQLFYDAGLTTQVTGYLFAARISDGEIFNLNNSSGIVGSDTSSNCNTGTSGSYRLGNGIPAICSASIITLYTNGAFAPGKVLYYDSALTNPVTGSIYVLNNATNHIFNLNTSTGVIGSDTGSTCTGTATLTFRFINGSGGAFLSFQAFLDRPIDANIAVNRIYADGYSDSICNVGVAGAQKNSTMNIAPGGTSVSSNPDALPAPFGWASAIKSSLFNAIINGISVSNGTVLSIGSYNVTIVIPTCA